MATVTVKGKPTFMEAGEFTPAFRTWIAEQCNASVDVASRLRCEWSNEDEDAFVYKRYVDLTFEDEHDAVLFKLWWL